MKDYKRLTDRVIAEMLRNTEEESWDSDNIEAQCYIRLAELEDKIESGELYYVADRDKQIARLTAENAELRATLSKMETVEKELRARLENAVELPCKVGDTVYWLSDTMIYEYKVQGFIFDTNELFGLRLILGEIEPSVIYCKDKKLFFDRAKAEARLKELKENNK